MAHKGGNSWDTKGGISLDFDPNPKPFFELSTPPLDAFQVHHLVGDTTLKRQWGLEGGEGEETSAL